MKTEKEYPGGWSDKEIETELHILADRLSTINVMVPEHFIHDAFRYNFGSTELQNRKTNRFSWLVIFIAAVTLVVAIVTAYISHGAVCKIVYF